MTSDTNSSNGVAPLIPPQLPHFLTNVFDLKPIVGNPTHDEVKLVHEALRALSNFMHTPELRNTDLSTELSQYLFDIQLVCHRQKYPVNILPNDVVYEPPTLPSYIPLELRSITGPPSTEEVASVHAALRISESFATVPAIFDSGVHVELSQHLSDLQLARHAERSIVRRFAANNSARQEQTASQRDSNDINTEDRRGTHIPASITTQETSHTTEPGDATREQLNPLNDTNDNRNLNEGGESRRTSDLMIEIRNIGETLKNMNRAIVASQNSLARGFNSSSIHYRANGHGLSHDLGAHSLINDRGEVPESHSLPTFKPEGNNRPVSLAINDLSENVLARYLRFYGTGEDMIEEEEVLKIKSGMIDDARRLLSRRLFVSR